MLTETQHQVLISTEKMKSGLYLIGSTINKCVGPWRSLKTIQLLGDSLQAVLY